MAAEQRSLTAIAADLSANAARLAGVLHLSGANAAPLTDLMSRAHATAEILSASGLGRAQGAGEARQEPHDAAELAGAMTADLAKLAAGLSDAGADPDTVAQLQNDAHALAAVAVSLAALPIADVTGPSPHTKALSSTRPGERPTSLDYAGHRLEAQLRAARLNREASR